MLVGEVTTKEALLINNNNIYIVYCTTSFRFPMLVGEVTTKEAFLTKECASPPNQNPIGFSLLLFSLFYQTVRKTVGNQDKVANQEKTWTKTRTHTHFGSQFCENSLLSCFSLLYSSSSSHRSTYPR